MRDQGPDVTIAGAGVLGLSCALALAEAGCRVSVRDPGGPGANASGVAAGMLAPAFEAILDEQARPHLGLLLHARDLWPAWAQRTGIELDRSGALAVGDDQWLGELFNRFVALDLRPAELPAAAARGLAPGLSESVGGALLTREDWRLDARVALTALRAAGEAAGVTYRAEPVKAREAGLLVIATGASPSLGDLAPELSCLSPIKGHIVRFAAPWAGGAVVRARGAYAAPGHDSLSIGATMEPGLADSAVDPGKAAPLRAAAGGVFPALTGAPSEIFAGVRAATPDGLPLAGASTAPGVFLAVGARRNGWLLAPLVAQVVAAAITGGDPGRFASRLDPARLSEGA